MRCYRHPNRETRLSCATCGRPICTECMVTTDVGIKCPDDARLPRGARAGAMRTNQLVRSLLIGLAVAAVGVPVVYVLFRLPLQLILSAAIGFGAGTLINRAGGRNGGPLAVAISVIATAVPFLFWIVPVVLAGGQIPIFNILSMVIASTVAGVTNRQL
jgi:hypothetical protein